MTEYRNTPREIVFDMEDTCNAIRRHAAVLRCLTSDEGLEDVVRDALVQVADGLSDSHRDLYDRFKRLFEQIVRKGADKPQPVTGAVADPTYDTFAIENHLVAVGGLARALCMMSQASDMQRLHSEALDAVANAIEDQQKALWGLMFEGGSVNKLELEEATPT